MVQSKKFLRFDFVEHYFLNKKETISSPYREKKEKAFSVEQVHENKILVITKGKEKTNGFDGMITSKHMWLSIRTADCLPIFFLDPVHKIIAGVHAGWKGLSLDIIKACIHQMKQIGSSPQDIVASVGPHIGVCCYNVSKERIHQFAKSLHKEKEKIARFQLGSWYLDLDTVSRLQMKQEGIQEENIDSLSICTACNFIYSSSRREGQDCQRMVHLIRITK